MTRPQNADLEWQLFGEENETDSNFDSSLEWAGNETKIGLGSFGNINGMRKFEQKSGAHLVWEDGVDSESICNNKSGKNQREQSKEDGDPLIVYSTARKIHHIAKKNSEFDDRLNTEEENDSDESNRLYSNKKSVVNKSRGSKLKGRYPSRKRASENHSKRLTKMYLLRAKRFNLKSLLFSKATLSTLARCQVSRYSEMTNYFGGKELRSSIIIEGQAHLKALALERELMTELFPTLYRSQNTYSDFSSSSLEEEESRASQEMYKVLETAVRYKDVLKMGTSKKDIIFERIFKDGAGLLENDENANNEKKIWGSKTRKHRIDIEESREVFFESFGKSFFGKDKINKINSQNKSGKKKGLSGVRQALKSKIKNWAEGSECSVSEKNCNSQNQMFHNQNARINKKMNLKRSPLTPYDQNNFKSQKDLQNNLNKKKPNPKTENSSFEGYLEEKLAPPKTRNIYQNPSNKSKKNRKNLIYFDSQKNPQVNKIHEIYSQSNESELSQNNFLAASESSTSFDKDKITESQDFILFTKENDYNFSRKEGNSKFQNREYYFEEKEKNFKCKIQNQNNQEELLIWERKGIEKNRKEIDFTNQNQNKDQKNLFGNYVRSKNVNKNCFNQDHSIYSWRKFSDQQNNLNSESFQIYASPKKRNKNIYNSANLKNHSNIIKNCPNSRKPYQTQNEAQSKNFHNKSKNNSDLSNERLKPTNSLTQTRTLSSRDFQAQRSYYCSSILEGPSSVENSSNRAFTKWEKRGTKKSPKITSNVKINSLSGYGNGSSTLSSAQDFLKVEASFPSLVLNQPVNRRVGRFGCASGEAIKETDLENEGGNEEELGDVTKNRKSVNSVYSNSNKKLRDKTSPVKVQYHQKNQTPNLDSENNDESEYDEGFKSFSNNQQNMIPNQIKFQSNLEPSLIKNFQETQTPNSNSKMDNVKFDFSPSKNITEESNLLEDEIPQSSSFSNQDFENKPNKPKIFESIFSFKHDSILLSSRAGLESQRNQKINQHSGFTSLTENKKIKKFYEKERDTKKKQEQSIQNFDTKSSKNDYYVSKNRFNNNKANLKRENASLVIMRDQRSKSQEIMVNYPNQLNLQSRPQSRNLRQNKNYFAHFENRGELLGKIKNAKSNPDFFKNKTQNMRNFTSQKNSICIEPNIIQDRKNFKSKNKKAVIQEFLNSVNEDYNIEKRFFTPKKKSKKFGTPVKPEGSFSLRKQKKSEWNYQNSNFSPDYNNKSKFNDVIKKLPPKIDIYSDTKNYTESQDFCNLKSNKKDAKIVNNKNQNLKKKFQHDLSISSNLCVFIARKNQNNKTMPNPKSQNNSQSKNRRQTELTPRKKRVSNNFVNEDIQKFVSKAESKNRKRKDSSWCSHKNKKRKKSKKKKPRRKRLKVDQSPHSKISLAEIEKLGQMIEEQREFIRSRSQNKLKKSPRQKENCTQSKKKRKKKKLKRLEFNKRIETFQKEGKNNFYKMINNFDQRSSFETFTPEYKTVNSKRLARHERPHNRHEINNNCAPNYSNRKSHQSEIIQKPSVYYNSSRNESIRHTQSFRESTFACPETQKYSKMYSQDAQESGYQDTIKKNQGSIRKKIVNAPVEKKEGLASKFDSRTGFRSLKYEDLHDKIEAKREMSKPKAEMDRLSHNRNMNPKNREIDSEKWGRNIGIKTLGKVERISVPQRKNNNKKIGCSPNRSIMKKKSFISLISGASKGKQNLMIAKKLQKAKTRKSGIRSTNHSFFHPNRSDIKSKKLSSGSPKVIPTPHSMTLNSSLSGYLTGKSRKTHHIVYTNPLGPRTNNQKMDKWESLTSQVQQLRENEQGLKSQRSRTRQEDSVSGLIFESEMKSCRSSKKLYRHRTFHKNNDRSQREIKISSEIMRSMNLRKSVQHKLGHDSSKFEILTQETGSPNYQFLDKKNQAIKAPKFASMKNSQKLISALSKNFTRKKLIEKKRLLELQKISKCKKKNIKNLSSQKPVVSLEVGDWTNHSQLASSPGLYQKDIQRPFTCKKPSKTAFFRSFKKSFEMGRLGGKEQKKKLTSRREAKVKSKPGNFSGYGLANKNRFFRTKK